MKMFIIVKAQKEALHQWPEAPEEVLFLRNLHRHIFYIEVKVPVSHEERDVEFILLKRKLEEFLNYIGMNLGQMSCESFAIRIYGALRSEKFSGPCVTAHSIKVFEDNENGAEVVFDG